MTLTRQYSALLLLAILALAALLRLWQLDSLPPGLYHDEAYNGLDALSLLQGESFPQFYEGWELYAQEAHSRNAPNPTRWPVFFEGNYGREPLHVYLMALSIWLFDATPFAIRLIPAVAGVVAVFTTFLAAKSLFAKEEENNQYVPLLAAFFVAVLYPAVHFSRFGIRPMLFVPMATLTIYFFWRGVNQQSARKIAPSFLWAGFFLGLGLYTYASGRLFPLLFVIFVPLWLYKDREAWRQHWLNIMLMVSAAFVTAVPLLIFFFRYPYFFVFRLAYVANRGKGTVPDRPWLTWLNNIGRVVRGLFWQGETHLRHNLPGRPYFDVIQAFLFILGLVRNGRFWPSLSHIFLVIWLIVMLLPTILSGDAPHFGRMTGAVPAVAIIMALGLAWLGERLAIIGNRQMGSRTQPRLAVYWLPIAIGGLLLAGSLFFTVRDYFGRYASHPQLADDFYLPDWQLGQFAAAQPPDATLYLSPTQEELATIYFALENPDRLRNYSGSGGVIPAGVPGQPMVYLLRHEETAVLQTLQSTFPEGRLAETPNANFMAFSVPVSAPRMRLAQTATAGWAEQIKLAGWSATITGNQLDVWLAWQAKQPISVNYTAFVHLLGTDGQIVAQLDKQPAGYPTSDWQIGELILDRFTITLPEEIALEAASHKLQTGFYELTTATRLGEPIVLTTNLAEELNP